MKTVNSYTSACRYCRYYKPEGRRGGMCQQLGVPVQGCWKACALASPPFVPSWQRLEGIVIWSDEKPVLPESLPIACTLNRPTVTAVEPKVASTPERKKAEPLLV